MYIYYNKKHYFGQKIKQMREEERGGGGGKGRRKNYCFESLVLN